MRLEGQFVLPSLGTLREMKKYINSPLLKKLMHCGDLISKNFSFWKDASETSTVSFLQIKQKHCH